MDAIRLDTFRALLDHGHGLDCWCPGCRRWAACDLAMLVRNGLGDRPIMAARPRCRKCGSHGAWQVRPPVPAFHGAHWMTTKSRPRAGVSVNASRSCCSVQFLAPTETESGKAEAEQCESTGFRDGSSRRHRIQKSKALETEPISKLIRCIVKS